ncbi:hypothetical protein E2562_029374 [Oryza meyeriana var. granulata]|uniref:Uncharacterized protein n=1 Tax=Oryza meyeriana var. granulata TaxID=110450 RepID=A0A6G1C1E0_9ORYZ|nr:hypothetical protein E2562_029374 [Oryza meyeriana var. granulata]
MRSMRCFELVRRLSSPATRLLDPESASALGSAASTTALAPLPIRSSSTGHTAAGPRVRLHPRLGRIHHRAGAAPYPLQQRHLHRRSDASAVEPSTSAPPGFWSPIPITSRPRSSPGSS